MYTYTDWGKVLKPDGNAVDAKVITVFALFKKVQDVILFALSPVYVSIFYTYRE